MKIAAIISLLVTCLFFSPHCPGQQFGPGVEIKKGGIKVNSHIAYSQNGFTLIIDMDNFGPDAEMVYFDSTCTVVDIYNGGLGVMLYQGFNYESAPPIIKTDVSKIMMFTLQNSTRSRSDTSCIIPDWTRDVVNIQYLQLADGNLEDMEAVLSLPIQHLVLSNIRIKRMNEFIQNLKQLPQLKYLAHSLTFKSDDIDAIQNALPDVQIMPISEYKVKFDGGRVQIDN